MTEVRPVVQAVTEGLAADLLPAASHRWRMMMRDSVTTTFPAMLPRGEAYGFPLAELRRVPHKTSHNNLLQLWEQAIWILKEGDPNAFQGVIQKLAGRQMTRQILANGLDHRALVRLLWWISCGLGLTLEVSAPGVCIVHGLAYPIGVERGMFVSRFIQDWHCECEPLYILEAPLPEKVTIRGRGITVAHSLAGFIPGGRWMQPLIVLLWLADHKSGAYLRYRVLGLGMSEARFRKLAERIWSDPDPMLKLFDGLVPALLSAWEFEQHFGSLANRKPHPDKRRRAVLYNKLFMLTGKPGEQKE